MSSRSQLKRHPTLHPLSTAALSKRVFKPTRHEFELDDHDRRYRATFDSRKARKGRFPLRSHRHAQLPSSHKRPLPLRLEYKDDKHKIKPHFRPDVTFWVAFFFELGSLVWVANGFCVWLPLQRPEYDSEAVIRAADALAFVGGTLFEIGAYLGLLEAGNRGKELDIGEEAERLLWGRPSKTSTAITDDPERQSAHPPQWEWLPSPRWRELGYLSAAVQMFAATIFWVSTMTGLPGVIPGYFEGSGSKAIVDVFFWTPQVIGGVGFVIASTILCIEVQPDNVWWKIRPLSLGWQIGFWNIVGSAGFLLCGALGYSSATGAVYESGLATFWGSFGFLIGSTLQFGEALWRDPSFENE